MSEILKKWERLPIDFVLDRTCPEGHPKSVSGKNVGVTERSKTV